MKHLDITLTGKVQRVGLRYQIIEAAKQFEVRGYARNMRSGEVFIEAEGADSSLNELLEWLKSSPGLSEVKNTDVSEGKVIGYREFQIY